MKIRAHNGEIVNLAKLHDHWFLCSGTPFMTVSSHDALAVIDALEKALNVRDSEKITVENEWDDGYEHGFSQGLRNVRNAAGLIEESA